MHQFHVGSLAIAISIDSVEAVCDAVDEAGVVAVGKVQLTVVYWVNSTVVVQVLVKLVAYPVLVHVVRGLVGV